MNGTKEYHVKWNNSGRIKQRLHAVSPCGIKKKKSQYEYIMSITSAVKNGSLAKKNFGGFSVIYRI